MQNVEYLTIEEYYRRNGWRHLERAIAYASAGYEDRFYEGSMKKALRNFKIAYKCSIDPSTPYYDLLNKIRNELSSNIFKFYKE